MNSIFQKNSENDMNNHPLASTIFMTIGAASVCWENKKALSVAGIFDSEHAMSLGEQLVIAVEKYTQQRVDEERKDQLDYRERYDKLLKAKHELSDNFVKIRQLVRTLNIENPTPTKIQQATVDQVDQLTRIGVQFANMMYNLKSRKLEEITQNHIDMLQELASAWDVLMRS